MADSRAPVSTTIIGTFMRKSKIPQPKYLLSRDYLDIDKLYPHFHLPSNSRNQLLCDNARTCCIVEDHLTVWSQENTAVWRNCTPGMLAEDIGRALVIKAQSENDMRAVSHTTIGFLMDHLTKIGEGHKRMTDRKSLQGQQFMEFFVGKIHCGMREAWKMLL